MVVRCSRTQGMQSRSGRLGSGGRVELALLDPPYNTRSRFHHYVDQAHPEQWLLERREDVQAVLPLLTETASVWIAPYH